MARRAHAGARGAWVSGETSKLPVRASRGVVVANHPLASAAGAQMFARGGNAVDAAMAACLAASVVEPAMSSIFGAGFVLIRLAGARTVALDNYIRSPAAARDGMFEFSSVAGGSFEVEGRLNDLGHLAVGVPGALRAYHEAVTRFGRLAWREVCAPAVEYARVGFPATPLLADAIRVHAGDIATYPETAAVFLPGDKPPSPGDRIVRNDYAATLEAIAAEGPELLYSGPLGRAVCDDMRRNQGLLTEDDLRAYRVRERAAVVTTYKGYEIIGMGPCSSGGTAVGQALNLLELLDLGSAGFGSARGPPCGGGPEGRVRRPQRLHGRSRRLQRARGVVDVEGVRRSPPLGNPSGRRLRSRTGRSGRWRAGGGGSPAGHG